MYIPRNFSHTVTVSIHHWWIFIRLWLCGKCTSQGGFNVGMVPSSKQRPVDGAQLVAPLVPVHYPSLLSYRNLFPKFSECSIVFPINHFHPLPLNDMVVPSYMVCNCTRVFSNSLEQLSPIYCLFTAGNHSGSKPALWRSFPAKSQSDEYSPMVDRNCHGMWFFFLECS